MITKNNVLTPSDRTLLYDLVFPAIEERGRFAGSWKMYLEETSTTEQASLKVEFEKRDSHGWLPTRKFSFELKPYMNRKDLGVLAESIVEEFMEKERNAIALEKVGENN